jgi:hypothetical protein
VAAVAGGSRKIEEARVSGFREGFYRRRESSTWLHWMLVCTMEEDDKRRHRLDMD